jgi:hypothetical protein
MKFDLKCSYRRGLNSPLLYFCLHRAYSSRTASSSGVGAGDDDDEEEEEAPPI